MKIDYDFSSKNIGSMQIVGGITIKGALIN